MTNSVTVRRPADLTLEALERIAWEGWTVALHPALLGHLTATRAAMLDALAGGGPVYGINTGMGYLSGVRLSEEEQETHQINLFLGRAVGGPPFLERAEARALLVARLAGFLGGQSGVTPDLCVFLADRLNDDFVPAIPRTGVGSAGEIIPLAHAFAPFMGIGQVLAAAGGLEDAARALARRGADPYRPAIKEGIALLAGAPGAVALTAARRRAADTLAHQLEVASACAIDAMRAPLGPYNPVLARLAADPVLERVLQRLNDLLRGSERDGGMLQAPVSFRVIPQVLAHLVRTLDRIEADLHRGLAAVADSPVFVEGHFLSTGGFHAIDLASNLDVLCMALVQAAELSGQHIHRMLDSRFTGLPDQLTPVPGPQAGLVAVQKRVVGTLNELRRLAVPATVGIMDTSMGQEDAMTFTFEAAEKLRRVELLVREVIACELLVCRQAWALRSSPVASGLARHVREIETAVPAVNTDRPLGDDIGRLSEILSYGGLTPSSPS